MPSPFEIEDADIKLLSDTQLTHLLRKLLLLEAAESGLARRSVSVSLEITIPDGGEDGRITWEEGPGNTEYIPSRFTVFQVKATQMDKEKFAREVRVPRETVLKPAMVRVVASQGCYVFFYGRTCNNEQKPRNLCRVRKELERCGVSNPDSIGIDIYGIDKIANWTNKFTTAVMFVQECCGRALPSGLLSWKNWSGYRRLQGAYFENSTLSQHIKFLRTHLAEEQHICRIEGLSGVGKTRLALEALRPSSEPEEYDRNALSEFVVYVNAGEGSGRVLAMTRDLVSRSMRAIIIVDECDALLHRRLEDEVTRATSKLSLLSLDYELSGSTHPTTITLIPEDLRDIVNRMLKSTYPGMSDFDCSRIAKMAEGFPTIANLLAEAHLNDAQTHLGQLSDDQLLDRLIWGREPRDEVVLRVLRACALFTQIGFTGDAASQRNLVAEEIARVSSDDFYRICRRYETRSIIQSREGYIRLALQPLALSLARRWWSETPPELIKKCIEMISGSELQEPFFRRLSKLDDVKEVQDEVAELCKPGALFVDDLALSTDSGSKIADYLCQVNPRAVMDLMKTECSSWSAEEWGRNAYSLPHLFWTLDKLLWWHTTFFDAAALLLDAIGKSTEAASRQAEEHFVALFRVNLPGTQSTLHERLRFLEQALDSDDEVKRRLIVRALGAGLTTGRVSRSGGIESQGSRKSQGDYRPATNNEILEYWGKCIDHLHKIIRSESELRELAMEELGNRLGGMVCEPMLDRLDNVVKDIAESPFGYWPDAAVSLNHFLGHDSSGHPKEVTERVTEWVRLLTPTTVENRLKLYVDTPARSHEKDSRGKYVDIAEAKAQVLAGELSTEGFDWTHYADLLLTGEQRQAMPFGERLAQLSPRKSSLLTSILTNLRGRDPRKTNLRLPAGFLWATQQADQIAFFDQLLSEQELLPFTMPLIAKGKPTVSHVRTLMRLVSDEKIPIEEFWHLQHSPFFDQLPETYRPEFLDNLVDLGIEGVRVAFEFVAFHCSYREEAFANYEIRIRSLLMTKGLALEAGDQGMFRYNVVENMIKYSKSKPDDLEFVEFLPAEILNLLENAQDYIEHDNDVGRLIRFLVDEHPALTWMSFGPCLLDEACPSQHVLLRLLGPRDYDDTSDSIAAHLPENLLKEWCHQNGAKAVITLTQIVPLLDSTNSWTDWAEFLFDEFHGEASVLNAVEFSIQPTSALGSFAPYYKARSDACRHLFNHKHARVRAWAERVASAYDRRAEREEAGDTERDWNYDW